MKSKIILALCIVLSACGGSSEVSSPGGGSSVGSSGSGSHSGSSSGSLPGGGSSSSGSVGGSSSGAPVQAGTLTAGDYDDLLNFGVYHKYISDFLQEYPEITDIPYVDVNAKVAVRVVDAVGDPLFGAKVLIRSEDQRDVILKTPANGVVHFYPAFDKTTDSVEIAIEVDGSDDILQTVALKDLPDERVIEVPVPSINQVPTQLDIALVVDSTGSMGDEIRYLKAELTQVFNDIEEAYDDLSLAAGLISYRDVGDSYVVWPYEMTTDLLQFELDLNGIGAAGGGDYPEAMDQAMEAALELEWRADSVKIILLVADAPPHNDKIAATWDVAKIARQQQIHIVPVAASGVGNTAEFLMRSMAALTNSRYIFLTDDSGVGNPHAEPSIDCYVVTRLDSAIRRVISQLVTGERVEPTTPEIIRTEGNYDAGVCLPVEDGSDEEENSQAHKQ